MRGSILIGLLALTAWTSPVNAEVPGGDGLPGSPSLPGGGELFLGEITRTGTAGTFTYVDLQAAVDAAQPGDVLTLDAGVFDGGVVIRSKSNLTIVGAGADNGTVIDGRDLLYGMQVELSSDITIANLAIVNAVATELLDAQGLLLPGDGGGLYVQGCTDVTIHECRFEQCAAVRSGGAIHVQSTTMCTIDTCQFLSNSAGSAGGALSSRWSLTTVSNSQFAFNSSQDTGGAVSADVSSTAEFSANHSSFEFNHAGVFGGAVHLHGSAGFKTSLLDCRFTGNDVGPYGSGGAVNLFGSLTLDCQRCTFDRNRGCLGGTIANSMGQARIHVRDVGMWGNRGRRGTQNGYQAFPNTGIGADFEMSRVETGCGETLSESVDGSLVEGADNTSVPTCVITADLDFSHDVGMGDLLIMFESWGHPSDPGVIEMADIVHAQGDPVDGRVDVTDLIVLLDAWGQSVLLVPLEPADPNDPGSLPGWGPPSF